MTSVRPVGRSRDGRSAPAPGRRRRPQRAPPPTARPRARDRRRRLGPAERRRIHRYAVAMRVSPSARQHCPRGSPSSVPTGSKPRRPPSGTPTRGSQPRRRAVAAGSARATRTSEDTSAVSRSAPTTERRASDNGALRPRHAPDRRETAPRIPACRRTVPTSAPRSAASAAAVSVGSPLSARYLQARVGAVPPDSRTARRRTVSIGSAALTSRIDVARVGALSAPSRPLLRLDEEAPVPDHGPARPVMHRRPVDRSTWITASMAPAL